jgi:hypothetical protein
VGAVRLVQTSLAGGLFRRYAPGNDDLLTRIIALGLIEGKTRYLSRLENYTGDRAAIAVRLVQTGLVDVNCFLYFSDNKNYAEGKK